MEARLRLDHRGDERRIDVVLRGLLVDDVAERHRVREEVAADGIVDPPHLKAEHAGLPGRRGRAALHRKPAVVEERDLPRDEALREHARELEQRVRREAILHPRHDLGALPILLLDDADGVEVLAQEEMDVVRRFINPTDGKCGSDGEGCQGGLPDLEGRFSHRAPISYLA